MSTRLAVAAVATALMVGPAALPSAQAQSSPRAGGVEKIVVHGKALEGNLEGDSPDRDVTIYLPPSYATERTRRYPVVYLLHGYGGRDDTFNGRLAKLAESADKLAASGGGF